MKETESEEVVTVGSHVIVQKLNFKKVYRVSETGSLALGKEEIKMSAIIGKPFWTTFKVIGPQEKRNDKYRRRNPPSTLVVADKCESLEDLKNDVTSGFDNRSINDDGKSQKLSKDDILDLRDAGKSGREIVSSLIKNNASFGEKTEYSQEKYIRKKEKKYYQYLSVHKPTLGALHEIYLRQDAIKIYGLRMDTLAQLLCYCDVKSDGTFILYDSGTAGLSAAAMLSRIGSNTTGNLIYLHSGDHLPQMPIVRAMNFSQNQLDRLTIVSIMDFLTNYYAKNETESEVKSSNINVESDKLITENQENSNNLQESLKNKSDGCEEGKNDIQNKNDGCEEGKNDIQNKNDGCEEGKNDIQNKDDGCEEGKNDIQNKNDGCEEGKNDIQNKDDGCEEGKNDIQSKNDGCEKNRNDIQNLNPLKRKNTENLENKLVMKKSRKVIEKERAVEMLSTTKADGLAIVTREHPLNIVNALLTFVKPSRPFVIYHAHREPLQETYVALKQQNNIINLRLFSNFLRSYQVMPDRTHPDILTNDCGGYILTGYITF